MIRREECAVGAFRVEPVDGATMEDEGRGVSICVRRRKCFCGMEDEGGGGRCKREEDICEFC